MLLVVHVYREDYRGEEITRIPERTANGISARPALANMVRLRHARPRKVAVSARLDAQVLNWLRSKGEGHLTRINDILTNLMEAEQPVRPVR